MNWWQRLKKNSLAKFGAIVLIVFYLAVIAADFVAPYDPFSQQTNGSLLPPTSIYWQTKAGQFIGPHIYPTTQGETNLETGDRKLLVDFAKPARLRLFVFGEKYDLFKITLPLPPSWKEVDIFPGIPVNLHLFGADGGTRFNLLGTDDQGRDQFSRLLFGGRISLFIGLVGVAVSFPLGIIAGGISGYFGGWIDAVIMRFAEVLMTFPSIYLLVSLGAVLPPGLSSTQTFMLFVLITSFITWAGLARVIRGQVLSIKEREFVQAARAMGASPFYIIMRHVLPQTATYIIISVTLTVPSFISAESVLSLIGLGIQPPDASWGNMLSLATNASILVLQPWLIWPPAIMIVTSVLAFNLLGDGLRDALDPRSMRR
ncbi:MAG: ABC transporter permease [Scytonematopsis contorta HA4267-MV1]|jgi:peptide/nickel transport system permease protein|nr:ABC transporter permease [Scytonematopsis contorta HA4267-MV1]